MSSDELIFVKRSFATHSLVKKTFVKITVIILFGSDYTTEISHLTPCCGYHFATPPPRRDLAQESEPLYCAKCHGSYDKIAFAPHKVFVGYVPSPTDINDLAIHNENFLKVVPDLSLLEYPLVAHTLALRMATFIRSQRRAINIADGFPKNTHGWNRAWTREKLPKSGN